MFGVSRVLRVQGVGFQGSGTESGVSPPQGCACRPEQSSLDSVHARVLYSSHPGPNASPNQGSWTRHTALTPLDR